MHSDGLNRKTCDEMEQQRKNEIGVSENGRLKNEKDENSTKWRRILSSFKLKRKQIIDAHQKHITPNIQTKAARNVYHSFFQHTCTIVVRQLMKIIQFNSIVFVGR